MSIVRMSAQQFTSIRDLGIEFRDNYNLDEFELARIMSVSWKLINRSAAINNRNESSCFNVRCSASDEQNIVNVYVSFHHTLAPYALSAAFKIDTLNDRVIIDSGQHFSLIPMSKENF